MSGGHGGNPNHDRRTGEFARGANSGLKMAVLSHGDKTSQISNMTSARFTDTVLHGNFTMLTASRSANTPAQNKVAMQKISHELLDRGIYFLPTVGKYGTPEPSFMCLHDSHFTPREAEDIGERYNQDSVMHVQEGKATMTFTTGENKGKVMYNTKPVDLNAGKDGQDYTGHQGKRFSFIFDWEAGPHEPETVGEKLKAEFNKGKSGE